MEDTRLWICCFNPKLRAVQQIGFHRHRWAKNLSNLYIHFLVSCCILSQLLATCAYAILPFILNFLKRPPGLLRLWQVEFKA